MLEATCPNCRLVRCVNFAWLVRSIENVTRDGHIGEQGCLDVKIEGIIVAGFNVKLGLCYCHWLAKVTLSDCRRIDERIKCIEGDVRLTSILFMEKKEIECLRIEY